MNRPEVHEVIRHLRTVADEFPGPRPRRRGVSAGRGAGRLPRSRARRRVPPRLRLRAAPLAVGASAPDPGHRAGRGAPPAGRVADVRHRQPRSVPAGQPLGRRSGTRRGLPAPHAARGAGAVRRRRDRHSRTRIPLSCRNRRSIAPDATATARRCSGTPDRRPASRVARPGCRWWIRSGATWPTSPPTRDSLLSLYRRLIAVRRATPALERGTHRSIFGVAPEVMAWVREADDATDPVPAERR